jgi:hypothetical protein
MNSKFVLLAIILGFHVNALAQHYYVNVYDSTEQHGFGIYVKSIDLNIAVIQGSIFLNKYGVIRGKKPVSIILNNREFFISFSENGGFNKNSQMGLGNYVVNYLIFTDSDNQLNEIVSDSIVGVTLGYVDQFSSEEGFRFGLRSDDNERDVLPEGIYGLQQDLNFILKQRKPASIRPDILRNIDNYHYLRRIFSASSRNLYTSYPYAHNVIRLNNGNTRVIDSLRFPSEEGQIDLYTYHPVADRIYLFHLNYEIHGKFTESERNYDDNTEEPQVLIYDAETFGLVETLPIPNYPDGDYPGPEEGIADIAGDFIVYYFFEDDWIGRFSPAMLFIFDTRTNEASWLRVGWR